MYWAQQSVDRFPDGQLYVNLRGFESTGQPVSPSDAVRGFLDAFGIPTDRISLNLDEQTALYRSMLAGRHMLIVLDNARDAEQVHPLLPGTSTCFVLVTSRHRLAGLVAHEGAQPIAVDILDPDEATTFLAGVAGAARVTTNPAAVVELIERCGRLPLALTVAARLAWANGGKPAATRVLRSLVNMPSNDGSVLASYHGSASRRRTTSSGW